jgi:hypothetical protein
LFLHIKQRSQVAEKLPVLPPPPPHQDLTHSLLKSNGSNGSLLCNIWCALWILCGM